MAYKTGSLSTFANKLITNEIIGAGTGSQTVFALQLDKTPVFIDSLEIEYTVSTVVYQATSDINGDITGTHITSGTVDEAGAVNLTFSTAPDVANIIANEYTTKGLVQMIFEFVRGTQADESLGVGDDIETVFSTTLSNTPVAKGQCRITFKIGTYIYTVWDNGEGGFDHDEINPVGTSLVYATSALDVVFNNPIDNLFDIRVFYSSASVEGRDWLVYLERTTRENGAPGSEAFAGLLLKEILLKNSGSTYKENVCVGFREFQYIPSTLYGINLKTYFGLDENSDWWDNNYSLVYDATTKGYTEMPHIALNDTDMDYWIMSNKNRIMGAVKVSATVYVTFYLGAGFRFSAPSLYPNPLIAVGPTYDNRIFSDTTSGHRYIANPPVGEAYHLLSEDDTFRSTSGAKMMPAGYFADKGTLKKAHNDNLIIHPVYAFDVTSDFLLFELDGVYYCPAELLQSEDTITIGADTYIIIQNIFRTNYSAYMALIQE